MCHTFSCPFTTASLAFQILQCSLCVSTLNCHKTNKWRLELTWLPGVVSRWCQKRPEHTEFVSTYHQLDLLALLFTSWIVVDVEMMVVSFWLASGVCGRPDDWAIEKKRGIDSGTVAEEEDVVALDGDFEGIGRSMLIGAGIMVIVPHCDCWM